MKGRRFLFLFIIIFCGFISSAQSWKEYKSIADNFQQQKKTDSAIMNYIKTRAELKRDSFYSAPSLQVSRIIGGLYYGLFQYNEAANYLEDAREIITRMKGTKNAEFGVVCNILGASYRFAGKTDTAESVYKMALETRKQLFGTDTSEAYAQSCNNLGDLYLFLSRYDEAEPLLLTATNIRSKSKTTDGLRRYAISCTGLANFYKDLGQYDNAETYYIKSRNIRQSIIPHKDSAGYNDRNFEYAASCNILADLYSYRLMYDKAEPLYIEAKGIREKDKNRFYGETCNNLGALYTKLKQFDKAESLLLEAKDIYDEKLKKGDPSITINHNLLGELYFANGNYQVAGNYFKNARGLWEKSLGKDHPNMISNADMLAKTYWNLGYMDNAGLLIAETIVSKYKQLDKVFQFTSESEKQLYLKNITGSNDEYQSFYHSRNDLSKGAMAYQLSLQQRNLILNSVQQTRQTIYSTRDTGLIRLYTDWTEVKQHLAKLYSNTTGNVPAGNITSLEEKAGLLEKELTRRSADFKRSQQKMNWDDIRQQLLPDQAAIEFTSFQLYDKNRWADSVYYTAIVLRKDLLEPVIVPLFEKRQLDSLLKKLTVNSPSSVNQFYNSVSVYKMTWQPVEQYLKGATKIYFAPSGVLHRLSLAALNTGDGKSLGDKYQMVQLLTTAEITDESEKKIAASDKIIMYGDVKYDADSAALRKAAVLYQLMPDVTRSVAGDFNTTDFPGFFTPLPGSAREIDAISRSASSKGHRVKVYKGVDANEESVKALSNEKTAFALHIATHGYFYPDPKENSRYSKEWSGKVFKRSDNPLFRSGLIMAGAENTWRGRPSANADDGILTAYEISNLYFPKAKLVVLSACETGLGDIEGGEGVYGLQRSFKMAGAEYLVMSLWDVPDTEASEFMQLFYKDLFNNVSIPLAFKNAQATMRIRYKNDPYRWGAWVLVK